VFELEPISAFADNYIWLISAPDAGVAIVVDPGEADPVLGALETRGLEVAAILVTHHHGDHVGGIGEILRQHRAPVFGPAWENISTVDHPVRGGDRIPFEKLGLELEVVDVPGHTAGHVAYLGPGFALVGDTLFAGGCGRVFEGTPEQMYASLLRLAALPRETAIYCAHEYTAANLRFAVEVEPTNTAIEERLTEVRAVRGEGRPTVPSTLTDELETNPYLRCREPAVVGAAEARVGRPLKGASDVFAVVRRWKDGWRG
jgi:hydroxyacylglutathione hydrolase